MDSEAPGTVGPLDGKRVLSEDGMLASLGVLFSWPSLEKELTCTVLENVSEPFWVVRESVALRGKFR